MKAISFEWDALKQKANSTKHGISFEEAKTVFSNPHARIIHDPDHSSEEDRFILLGMSQKMNILVICHCYKQTDEIIRIISARKASKIESKYYGG
ncbi:MAG TPA: BrnT family toxin [Treponema sp.]|nr:BrnT family toxin [Treponema sp.]HKL84837.1 BrnT family toxin [Treponemataceae bacterium]